MADSPGSRDQEIILISLDAAQNILVLWKYNYYFNLTKFRGQDSSQKIVTTLTIYILFVKLLKANSPLGQDPKSKKQASLQITHHFNFMKIQFQSSEAKIPEKSSSRRIQKFIIHEVKLLKADSLGSTVQETSLDAARTSFLIYWKDNFKV